jgi:hypothetical protein
VPIVVFAFYTALLATCGNSHDQRGSLLTSADVLTYAMKADEPLRWQHAFLSTELEALFANLKTYPLSATEVGADKTLTDGIPKSVDEDCPVCYKTCSDDIDHLVCCTSCGHHVHEPCFHVRAVALEG